MAVSPITIATLIDLTLAGIERAMMLAVTVERMVEEGGGELTPEERSAQLQRLRAARSGIDEQIARLERLARPQDGSSP